MRRIGTTPVWMVIGLVVGVYSQKLWPSVDPESSHAQEPDQRRNTIQCGVLTAEGVWSICLEILE